ncbi:hypothetical protein B0H17DRAFT_705483 [Mycena rosella]|uniref:GST N-terminal domain-containing protein n=1 Tax=Mycena rosella TaxID=1033263 RepID=A0AAD7DA94_MYCRO|nr:hypothetical protein B0H17DRAFT_705483 [Mycena rosella]
MSNILTLYDIASTVPGQAWSPNTTKARYALNFKGIPFKTVWVEHPDIEALCKKIGAKSTSATGLQYTLPVIHDPSTGAVVSDSIEIAQYLDATYPSLPRLIPAGTAALHYAFTDAHAATLGPLYAYALPATLLILNPAGQDYFRRTREKLLFGGRRLEDVTPTGDEHVVMWKKLQDGLDQVDGWISKNGSDSKYFMGEVMGYADITIGAYLRWAKVVLEKEKWEDILSWNGGRWANLMRDLEKYETVL